MTCENTLWQVQRRIQGEEDDLLACCESIRRQEADTFHQVSSRIARFLQDLAVNAGCSDDQWAIIATPSNCAVTGLPSPPLHESAVLRQQIPHENHPPLPLCAVSNIARDRRPAAEAPELVSVRRSPQKISFAVGQHSNNVRGETAEATPDVGRGIVEAGERDGQRKPSPGSSVSRRTARPCVPSGGSNHPTGSALQASTEIELDSNLGREGGAGILESTEEEVAQPIQDTEYKTRTLRANSGDLGLNGGDQDGRRPAGAPPPGFPASPLPIEMAIGCHGPEYKAATPKVTMASAGMLLLARAEKEGSSKALLRSTAIPGSVREGDEVVAGGCSAEKVVAERSLLLERHQRLGLSVEEGIGQADIEVAVGGENVWDNERRRLENRENMTRGSRPQQSSPRCTSRVWASPAGISRNDQPAVPAARTYAAVEADTPRTTTMSYGSPTWGHPNIPASPAHSSSLSVFAPTIDTAATAIDPDALLPPEWEKREMETAVAAAVAIDDGESQQRGARDHVRTTLSNHMSGDGDGNNGWGENYHARSVAYGNDPYGDTDTADADATKRLLQEAARIKRLLAAMERSDATAEGGADGLENEDSARFISSLGLVELKPIEPRLEEALECAAPPTEDMLFSGLGGGGGDPCVNSVPEPRTTRALRDQVRVHTRVCCVR